MAREIKQNGLDLIKDFEGFRADAYLCPAQVWTIGYGHTRGVEEGQRVDEARAEELLREDLAWATAAVERYIAVALTDNQFDALASFTFNLGADSLRTSTLRKKLNRGDYQSVPAELARWVRAGGKVLPGLQRRRAAEGALFLTPDDDAPLPMPQKVEALPAVVTGYLGDRVDLKDGDTDDRGDARYASRSQNVPDDYVFELQSDLRTLGFDAGEPDGAFGGGTERAVRAFQQAAGVAVTGVVDAPSRNALAQWLAEGYSKDDPPTAQPDAEAEGLADGSRLIARRVPHFSQGDPRWASRTLGKGSSLQKQGCAISCIAMILSYYGRPVTPDALDEYLDANQGYVGNSVVWDVAGRCGATEQGLELSYKNREGTREALVAFLHQQIDRGCPTMVRVDYGEDQDARYNHFVLAVGRTADGAIIMNDPATRHGDGYANPTDDNIIQRTTRQGGYDIVRLDYYEPV